MKRRKVDAAPVPTSTDPPLGYERSMHHHQHLYGSNTSNSPPMSSYAQLQQQLHLQQQQQQRLAASGRYTSERRNNNSPYPAADERAMHMRAQQQQQRASQGTLRSTNGVALQRSSGGSSASLYPAAPVGSRVQQDHYTSAPAGSSSSSSNKRRYEQYQQQQPTQTQYQTQQLRSYPHPSAMMPRTTSNASTSSPNSSPFSIASSISTSCSPVATMATSGSSSTTTTTSRAMGTESPLSLPGISSMLRMPSSSSNLNAGDTLADGSLSVHSPMVMPGSSNSNNMFSLPYKWTPEMASISPMKVNAGVAPPAVSLSSSSQQDTNITSRSGASGYYSRSRSAAAGKPTTATVIPESAAAYRSRSTRHRQSFDSSDGKSYSLTSSNSNTPRSQISSNGDEQVQNRNGLTPSSTTGSGPTTAATTASASEERIANPNKNSRYLREMDRREILARIEQGEKQATLAKEYQVSRAAICNLNKHREDVMLRKDENPLAKHPKKPRPKSLKVKVRSSKAANRRLPSPRLNGAGGSGKNNNTHEVKSRAAALLLTSLRNKNTSMSEFRRSSDRLVRLVVEEALALVPIKAVEVFLSDSVRADGVGWEHPPCAISMESQSQQHSAKGGSPLLDLFRSIEPDQPTARASVIEELDHHYSEDEGVSQSKTQQVDLVDTHLLPTSLKYHNVFVFDVSATSSDAICAVVQRLQERGAVEAMISVVVLFINSEVIASVHKKYPGVKIVAAQIDPSGKTPPAEPTASAPGANSADGGIDATANGEKSSSAGSARPPCCLELVLSRFRQLYVDSFTATSNSNSNKRLGSHLIS